MLKNKFHEIFILLIFLIYFIKYIDMKYPYRLVVICNGIQKESVGAFHTELQGIKMMNEMSKKALETVLFPTKFINTLKIQEAKFELILIKKREKNDPLTNKLRNTYGEYVDHETNNDTWLVIDKAPYEKEETFWVYGYHPLTDRKTFSFIMDELITPKAQSKTEFLNVKLFLNKVILSSQSGIEFVTAKNKKDAIRLYNTIKDECIKNKKKLRYVCFSGDCNSTHLSRRTCIKELMDLTNWNEKKIIRSTTKSNKTWLKKKSE